MPSNVTRWAIEKNRIMITLLVLVAIGGVAAYLTMPRSEDPGFIVRTALVTCMFPGATAERIDQLVADPLENSIRQMPEVETIRSQSKMGAAIIKIDISERYTELRPIWDDLRRRVADAKNELPQDVIGPFVNDDFGDVFGIIVTVTGETGPSGGAYDYSRLEDIARDTRDELLLIEEVARVEIQGIQEERIFIEYSNAKLAELGISPYQLKQILDNRNIVIPGGSITTGDERIVLEPSGNFESLEDLRQTVIRLPERSELVYLQDIAEINRGYMDPPETKVRANGIPGLSLGINLREGGNIIELGEQVKELIRRLERYYPVGIDFDIIIFQPFHVSRRVRTFSLNLIQAITIVVIVMLLTMGVRTGFVVGALIPMTILSSFLIMSVLGIWIDQISLAAMIIALGMLVDAAIVVCESTMVLRNEGKDPVQAAILAADEHKLPLMTSALTTSAAFLPIFLAESEVGEYTAPLFKVVTITLLASWVLSMTMTPLLSVWFMRVKKEIKAESFNTRVMQRYRSLLISMLKHPILSLSITALIFIASIISFGFVPEEFFPPSDKTTFTAEFELPYATPIERTDKIVREIEAFMQRELKADGDRAEGIMNWATFIGQGPPRFELPFSPVQAAPEYAMMLVNTTSVEVITEKCIPALQDFTERYPGMITKIRPLQLGPPIVSPIEVRISGEDNERLFENVELVRKYMDENSNIRNVRDDWGRRVKKIFVRVSQTRARRAGLTSRDVAVSLQTVLSGLESTQYRETEDVIPVVIRTVTAERDDIGKLETHNIYVQQTGRSVPLEQVADLELQWDWPKIYRRNGRKTVTLFADVAGDVTAIETANRLDEWLSDEAEDWPLGYNYELGGELEKSGESNASILEKLPIAGLVIFLLLVAQFNSLRKTLIILLTVPLGIIGVVFGLVVTQSYFGFMTLLGIVALTGIVVNDAIVLLERIDLEREYYGFEVHRAIVEAAQRRMRPILLTSVTTVCGLLPLWLGGGIMFEPMAVTLIFGLIFATVLTLGVVPVIYAVLYRINFKGYTYHFDPSGQRTAD
ncbi:Cation efflux system protein CusA [Anaerohalosphaera lusitana]|uniref:Cation efflux system protein CusA n=1 Tax=Anaerohalosphaera lusitana TaxID=1936003 RepID=A0A1U9NNF5_9BACT|nr:efflux RND transporter permease subunit [Anaerohalosphaera lusitana]AQT69429.1 Cation efflux system protein CusA [Anaerohalosphaera lusitana]